jgi:hypothetical protein
MVAMQALYRGVCEQQLGAPASSFNTFRVPPDDVVAVLEAGTPDAAFVQWRALLLTTEGWIR